jgi:rhodanese-related sulfurtransferase
MLDYHGIAVSAGSACSSHEEKPSYVLKAIGLSDLAAQETIRVCLGCNTSAQDIRYTTKALKGYFEGKMLLVNMIGPAQLNESVLFDKDIFILDVRPQFYRRQLKSLPNSHEVSFASIEKYLPQIPRDKNILVVCHKGTLSVMISYYLKSKGYNRVGNLLGGHTGWKKQHPDLYQKYAGQGVMVLQK